mgnify:CR=1 FL=1
MEYVRIGHIINTFGLKGDLKVFVMTDFRKQRFHSRAKLYFFDEKSGKRVEFETVGYKDQGDIINLRVKEINSIDEAEQFKNWFIEIDKEEATLPEGYVRLEDLKGCSIIDSKTNDVIGTVIDVQTFSPTPNLKIKSASNKIFYVPFVDKFIIEKNIEEKFIKIEVVEGMI